MLTWRLPAGPAGRITGGALCLPGPSRSGCAALLRGGRSRQCLRPTPEHPAPPSQSLHWSGAAERATCGPWAAPLTPPSPPRSSGSLGGPARVARRPGAGSGHGTRDPSGRLRSPSGRLAGPVRHGRLRAAGYAREDLLLDLGRLRTAPPPRPAPPQGLPRDPEILPAQRVSCGWNRRAPARGLAAFQCLSFPPPTPQCRAVSLGMRAGSGPGGWWDWWRPPL